MERRSFLALGFGWIPFHQSTLESSGIKFYERRQGWFPSHRYLVIHGDETTAKQLLETWMYFRPGIAYTSVTPTRVVPILGGVIDPNRMFSRVGAESNLRKLNSSWNAEQIRQALDLLDKGRETLIRHFKPPAGGLLIALHNNSGGYNVNEELADSDQTSVKQPERPHEFFLCTDERDFADLASSPYNVVLQNKKPAQDDGSLSRQAAQRGFRYVNLETTLGYYEAQLERLEWLITHLPDRR